MTLTDTALLKVICQPSPEMELLKRFHGPVNPRRVAKDVRRIREAYLEMGVTPEQFERSRAEAAGTFDQGLDAHMDQLVTMMAKDVIARKLPNGDARRLSALPIVATWTGEINGFTLALPSGAQGIVLDAGTITLSRVMMRSIVDVVGELQSDGRDQRGYPYRRAIAMMVGVLQYLSTRELAALGLAMRNYIDAIRGGAYNLDVHYAALDLQEFLLVHEFGHLLKGHLEHVQTRRTNVGSAVVEVSQISWNLEFEADEFATSILLSEVQGWGRMAGFLQILDRGCGSFEVAESTHPPWGARLQGLLAACPDEYQVPVRDYVAVVNQICDEAEALGALHDLNALWPNRLGRLRL